MTELMEVDVTKDAKQFATLRPVQFGDLPIKNGAYEEQGALSFSRRFRLGRDLRGRDGTETRCDERGSQGELGGGDQSSERNLPTKQAGEFTHGRHASAAS